MICRSCDVTFRVRYAETDQMGIAHHSNYFVWFEMGRSELCLLWGVPYEQWEKAGVILPLAEVSCRYRRPALYDEQLRLVTTLDSVSRVSVSFSYRLLGAEGEHRAQGWTKHAFASPDGKLIKGGHEFLSPLIETMKRVLETPENA